MDKIVVDRLLKAPLTDGVYGYLYLSKPADSLIKIIPDFNTINEVWDDLQLLNRKQWFASLTYYHQPDMITYEVRGHGFLKEYKE